MSGSRVSLTVDDSGPGIAPEDRPKLFHRFHRATDQGNGAGLGLAIADSVVRATGGEWRRWTRPVQPHTHRQVGVDHPAGRGGAHRRDRARRRQRCRSSPTRHSPSPGRRRPISCGPRIPVALRRPDAAIVVRALPDRRTRSPHPGFGVRAQPACGRHVALVGEKTVVGIVQNPQSLLDEFKLVPTGEDDTRRR